MKYFTFLGLAFLSLVILVSCVEKPKYGEGVKTYNFTGTIIEIAPDSSKARVKHGEIKDFMMAMTMDFPIDDKSVLEGLKAGDSISGVLAIGETHGWLAEATRIGKAKMKIREEIVSMDNNRSKKITEGSEFPNFSYINQDNKTKQLADLNGKYVIFTYIFTRCPFPDFCIRMSSQFNALAKLLKDDQSLKNKYHLLTISFDPDYDDAAVMNMYGKKYTKDFSNWEFVTSDQKTIDEISGYSGLVAMKDGEASFAHNLSTVVIAPDGTLKKILTGNAWEPIDIVNILKNKPLHIEEEDHQGHKH